MKKACIYIVVFLAIQAIAGFIVQGLWTLISGDSATANSTSIILTTVLFSVAVIAVFLLAKWSEVSKHWVRKRPWITLTWCVVAAFGAIIPSIWMQEHMPELPNIAEDTFDMIMKDRWGYLSIGLLAPLAEELVFRGAILRSLLKWTSRPWVAIAISAVFFRRSPPEPRTTAACIPCGASLGLDVLPHRQHRTLRSLSLDKQYCSLRNVQPIPQRRPHTCRSLRIRAYRTDGRRIFALYAGSGTVPTKLEARKIDYMLKVRIGLLPNGCSPILLLVLKKI